MSQTVHFHRHQVPTIPFHLVSKNKHDAFAILLKAKMQLLLSKHVHKFSQLVLIKGIMEFEEPLQYPKVELLKNSSLKHTSCCSLLLSLGKMYKSGKGPHLSN